MYRFGTAEKIQIASMLIKINNCLRIYQNRSIILVGHGISGDLAAIKALGFDFQENQVIAKLDTYLLARYLQMGDFTFENLLMELKCPSNFKLHNGGNDANVALRALLSLGVKAIWAGKATKRRRESRYFGGSQWMICCHIKRSDGRDGKAGKHGHLKNKKIFERYGDLRYCARMDGSGIKFAQSIGLSVIM